MRIAVTFCFLLCLCGNGALCLEPPIPIEDCPTGCVCQNIGCRREKKNLYCRDVEVICVDAGVTQRLEILPSNVTRLSITGENMGKNTLDIFARFTKLEKLNLANNVIRRLDITKRMKYLDFLNLNGNRLCFLPRKNLTLLPKLRMMKVQSNNLTFIHEIQFPSRLVDLDLSHNHIETPRKGSFRRMRKLRFLRLQNNSITSINPLAFRHLVNLESLLLDNNKIKELGPNTFKLLPSVSLVSLTHNLIKRIDPEAFKQMGVRWHSMHEIRLEHNLIRVLDGSSLEILYPRRNIYALYLDGNPILCDCMLQRIVEDYRTLLRDLHRVTCDAPGDLNGMILSELELQGCTDDDDFYYDDY